MYLCIVTEATVVLSGASTEISVWLVFRVGSLLEKKAFWENKQIGLIRGKIGCVGLREWLLLVVVGSDQNGETGIFRGWGLVSAKPFWEFRKANSYAYCLK